MIKKNCFLMAMLLLANSAWPQLSQNRSNDSLSLKSFEYLKSRFEETIYERAKSKIYVQAWLNKARGEKNNFYQMALAYKASIINSDKASRILYADSMINAAAKTNNDELIGSSYMTKGIIHYDRMEHIKALDNYLIADKYISQVNNPVLVYKIKYGIALTKYYLGFYDEAISLLRECADYFENENDRAYLNALHGLSLCYNHVGNYKLSSATNQLGFEKGRLFEDTGMECYFNQSEGINQVNLGNYSEAILKLDAALPEIIALKDSANEALVYFYLGKSYWLSKEDNKAVGYFKKVDQIFRREKYILPDVRQGYEYLIDYYKKQDDTSSQLKYINQLLTIDHLLSQDYKYLLQRIVKEYDTKELVQAKNGIENTILFTRIGAFIVIVLMAFTILILIRRNRNNRKHFEALMVRDTTIQPVMVSVPTDHLPEENNGTKNNSTEISPDIEAAIVKKLEKFELNKKYLEKDMTLAKMATILHTNSKYVTKVIAKHRGKGTIDYITDLKIDYIIELLKTESRFRNYTNKALGEEAGFGSTQNFTRAFKSHTGITPTYFIYKLKKSITADNSQ